MSNSKACGKLLWYVNLPDLVQQAAGSAAGQAVHDGIQHDFALLGPRLAIFRDLNHFGSDTSPPGCGASAGSP